jgi:MYXO-CTERM domain-containing protein
MTISRHTFALGLLALASSLPAAAQSLTNVAFVNGLAIAGASLDLSTGSAFDRRVGFFSDIYYDRANNAWWGLSDRGPGGGTLPYDTRMQRFTLDVDAGTGAISNFRITQTVLFSAGGTPLNGLAPNPASQIGSAFDPEGLVVNPRNGHFIVSDEYGPSVYEVDRNGQRVRSYTLPANLVPRTGAGVDYNAVAGDLVSGREGNRGFEGLAISPDGRFVYAMLQNGTVQDGWSGANRGAYTRIVKFDTTTGEAVGQYAYKLESSGQGRGISALVALGGDRFLVLERNNRGIGVGATLAAADKNVFEIDLSTASDVSRITLPATGNLPAGFSAAVKGAKVMDLDANTLAALGNKSPEKWEGLAVGPQLANGKYLVLAGTDNDYSVTQNGSNVQFDVYFRFSDADPYAGSIQCPVGQVSGCSFTTGGAPAALSAGYALLPGVLHAYTADIGGYTAPVPEPGAWALWLAGLGLLPLVARRRR